VHRLNRERDALTAADGGTALWAKGLFSTEQFSQVPETSLVPIKSALLACYASANLLANSLIFST
jgi:hypothetical protein